MFSTGKMTRTIALTAAALVCVGTTTGVMADTQWQKNHPRREQVNHRLARQNVRIHNEVKEGELTHAQAANLHHEDRQIRGEERAMASQDGGHITKAEQGVLNAQENGVSRQIGR